MEKFDGNGDVGRIKYTRRPYRKTDGAVIERAI